MKPQVNAFLNSLDKQKVKSIHVIGHSLGGAIATIFANWIACSYGIKPYLYTFGSPRVGLEDFADACTKKLTNKKIFRVYHKTDIVPYIPVWPFMHAPLSGHDYYVFSPGTMPLKKYHDMDEYVYSMKAYGNSWEQLGAQKPEDLSNKELVKWLERDVPESLNITTINWLNQALSFVLKSAFSASIFVLQTGVGTAFTVIDKIAYILRNAIKLANEVSNLVFWLIRKMLHLMGYVDIANAADMTQHYIRDVLMDVQFKLNMYAKDALSQALVKGNAI